MAPAQTYSDDAGFDLTVSRDMTIFSGQLAAIPTNVCMAIPDGYWGLLLPRSSTFYRRGLYVNPGVIDAGYRGEILALVHNIGEKAVLVRAGERLFQIILVERIPAAWAYRLPGELPKSKRDTAGIGSTGGTGENGAAKATTERG